MIHPPIVGSGFGLRGEYFDDLNFGGARVMRLDTNPDFTWPGQPHPGIGADIFSVRWTGRIQPTVTATFTFYTLSADGVRLWIAGTNLINNWTDHAVIENSAVIALQAGQLYDVRLEFYNAGGQARIQLAWSAPGLPRQPVPRAQLYPPSNPANQPPAIAFISPANNAGFPPGNLALNVNAVDPDGAIYKVRYFTNGALLGESLTPPFNFTWPNPPRGAHTLAAVAVDDNLVTATSAPVTIHIVSGFTTNETLIATGAVWRVWDRGSLPATNWTSLAYDDAGWSSGPAQLGYGDSDEATVVSYGPNASSKYISTYFRRAFNVTASETVTGFRFRVIRDDGVAVYLNGSELFRDNLPAGALSFGTLASTTFGPPEESTFMVTNLAANSLTAGTNLLACEIHQGAVDSSDISFELELTAVRSVLAPFIVVPPASVTVYAGMTVNFGVIAGGAPPLGYQWRLDGMNLPGAAGPVFTVQNLQLSTAGAYTVVIANSLGSVTSAVATATLMVPPRLEAEPLSGTPRFRFIRLAGVSLTVESSTNLLPGSWTPFTNLPALVSGEEFEFSVSTTNAATGFKAGDKTCRMAGSTPGAATYYSPQ